MKKTNSPAPYLVYTADLHLNITRIRDSMEHLATQVTIRAGCQAMEQQLDQVDLLFRDWILQLVHRFPQAYQAWLQCSKRKHKLPDKDLQVKDNMVQLEGDVEAIVADEEDTGAITTEKREIGLGIAIADVEEVALPEGLATVELPSATTHTELRALPDESVESGRPG